MPMSALRCLALIVPVLVCCEVLCDRMQRVHAHVNRGMDAEGIAVATRELSSDLAVAREWLRPILTTGVLFFVTSGTLFLTLGVGPQATSGWFARLPRVIFVVVAVVLCWAGYFMVLYGPNKVARQVDDLNSALKAQQLPQNTAGHEGAAADDLPDRAGVGVSGPHGVQWLMTDDTLAKMACLSPPHSARTVHFADEL